MLAVVLPSAVKPDRLTRAGRERACRSHSWTWSRSRTSPQAKRAIIGLLNLVEDLQATVRELQGEVQRLRDENNHLKGKQGQPDREPNRRGKESGLGTDHSSEAERRKPQTWQKGGKRAQITRISPGSE